MNYIEFFEKEVPDWMRESNRMMQLVGFNTPAYWNWVIASIDNAVSYTHLTLPTKRIV